MNVSRLLSKRFPVNLHDLSVIFHLLSLGISEG